jgi:hypothetical protein
MIFFSRFFYITFFSRLFSQSGGLLRTFEVLPAAVPRPGRNSPHKQRQPWPMPIRIQSSLSSAPLLRRVSPPLSESPRGGCGPTQPLCDRRRHSAGRCPLPGCSPFWSVGRLRECVVFLERIEYLLVYRSLVVKLQIKLFIHAGR